MEFDRKTEIEIQRKHNLHNKYEKIDKKLDRNLRFLKWQQTNLSRKNAKLNTKNYKTKMSEDPSYLSDCSQFQIMQNIDSSMFDINKTSTFIIENNVQLSDTEMTKHEVPNHLRQVPINMEQEKPNMSLSDKIKYLQKHFKNGIGSKFNHQCLKHFGKICEDALHALFYDKSAYDNIIGIKEDFKNMGLKLEKKLSSKMLKNNKNTAKKNAVLSENRMIYDIEEDETELVKEVKLFQRLLRGRAYQTMIMMAKIRYKPFLKSEKSSISQALDNPEPTCNGHNETQNNVLEFCTRRYISRFFDALSKESVQTYEESKNAMTVELGEATRTMREAYEGKRRQTEQVGRKEQEEILKQVLKIHQDLSELFSEEFIEEAIEQCAKEEALKLIKEVTSKKAFCKNKFFSIDCKNIENELVYSTIIPEAYKIIHREDTN